MSEYHRLTGQKYSEAEYLFQTIEMAKSDEEYSLDLSSSPPTHTDLDLSLLDSDITDPCLLDSRSIKRRRARRRYTFSQGEGNADDGDGSSGTVSDGISVNINTAMDVCAHSASSGMPPAPPSTPTNLTPPDTSLTSSLPNSGVVGAVSEAEQQHFNSLIFRLDYPPKYKNKLKDQHRTEAEISELFKDVSISASSSSLRTKRQPERGVSSASHSIRKPKRSTKTFKIYSSKEQSVIESDEENSVSAPEYDTEEEDTRFYRLRRTRGPHQMIDTKRQRRLARFHHKELMEAIVDTFDEAMNFNEN